MIEIMQHFSEEPVPAANGSIKISVVIPALNEAPNLPYLLHRIPQVPEIIEVILVDGGSTDGTVEAARELLPEIRIIRQDGRGKGNAVKCGAAAARGNYFVVLDADGSQLPEEIPTYIEKVKEGFDLVKGSRYLNGWKSEDDTLDRALMNKLTTSVANLLWGTRHSDLCYGLFLINRSKFLDLKLKGDYFELEVEMMAKAKKKALKVAEVPANELPRRHGKSNLSYLRDGWLIFKTVLLEWLNGF